MICGMRYSENQTIVGATTSKKQLERLFLECVPDLKNKKLALIARFIRRFRPERRKNVKKVVGKEKKKEML